MKECARKKVLLVFGTRPEAIKMIPVIMELRKSKNIEAKVCITAQHRAMLDSVLELFGIVADYDLDIMRENQDLFGVSASILQRLKGVLEDYEPHLVLVHGDTTTTFIGALCAFYHKISVGHIEAGLRTHDKYSPFPEEMNRQLTTRLATYHFAPTKLAYENLLQDGVNEKNIKIVGNSVIDCLKLMIERLENSNELRKNIVEKIGLKREIVESRFILATIHRRESFGEGVRNIANALKEIAQNEPQTHIIYPMHLNPNIQNPMREILGDCENIHLIKPLDYECFVFLMSRCYMILTDSGGIQEEATSIHKPTLILRETTERKEALECKTLRLIGTNTGKIVCESLKLLNDKSEYESMANVSNSLPYGDGSSAKQIVEFIENL